MRMAPQHTFQVLTKRPERMRELLTRAPEMPRDVLPNVWLGVSVEDQETADERIPLLLRTPAAVRFLSCEPLLGAIDLRGHLEGHCTLHDFASGFCVQRDHPDVQRLGWVIVGGESGRHGRPFDIAWARSIMAQCRAANVPVLIKQLGVDPRWNGISSPEEPGWPTGILRNDTGEGNWRPMLRDRKGGNMAEWPEDLRVREYPGSGRRICPLPSPPPAT
jgi:protein gp37